ncbi:hypothetical protein C0583_03305 [Candidatus Parcubacteria bacterium]|nr:MAG: hypothetical protein C0583_03305 [Candidatus Parcubacteria bacterium]
MICPQCKKQIPDTSAQCPFCAHGINHKEQVPKEIAMRRYQRWFFYGFIVILFLGMIATIAKIYDVNTKLSTQYIAADSMYKEKASELESTKTILTEAEKKNAELEQLLGDSEKEISAKTESYKEVLFEKGKLEEKYNNEKNVTEQMEKNVGECEDNLAQTDAMVYKMIVSLSMGISNENLSKIPVAEANMEGVDQDGDGLSDVFEEAIGTIKDKKDSDDDGFEDKSEILNHFNPSGEGALPYDEKLINALKGRILLQVEGNGEAWYVDEGKRYFLGRPGEALRVLANL